MKTYAVPVTYEVYGFVEVEAEDFEDLQKKLRDYNFVDEMPLAEDPGYIDGSYEINFELMDTLNEMGKLDITGEMEEIDNGLTQRDVTTCREVHKTLQG